MVRGIESFREWFRGYEDQYAIFGGTACDLLMTDEGDLTERKAAGESVDSKNIRKHKNDVFRLTELLDDEQDTLFHVPEVVLTDVREFIKRMASEDVDLKQLGIRGKSKEDILNELRTLYR